MVAIIFSLNKLNSSVNITRYEMKTHLLSFCGLFVVWLSLALSIILLPFLIASQHRNNH